MATNSKIKTIFTWTLRVAAAVILLQTLFFKFTGAPESVYIFSKVGLEPWGRIGSGVAELIAAILILFPPTTWLGAGVALAVMTGAIFSHLTGFAIGAANRGRGCRPSPLRTLWREWQQYSVAAVSYPCAS